jgi:hypothetical protein
VNWMNLSAWLPQNELCYSSEARYPLITFLLIKAKGVIL